MALFDTQNRRTGEVRDLSIDEIRAFIAQNATPAPQLWGEGGQADHSAWTNGGESSPQGRWNALLNYMTQNGLTHSSQVPNEHKTILMPRERSNSFFQQFTDMAEHPAFLTAAAGVAGVAAGGASTANAANAGADASWGANAAGGGAGTGYVGAGSAGGAGAGAATGAAGAGAGAGTGGFLGMSGGQWGMVATQLGGAYLGSEAAKDASREQTEATNAAIGEQRRQFDLNRSDLAPWRERGDAAGMRLNDLMGLPGGAGEGSPGYGSLNNKFTLADFWDDPVTQASFEFGLGEGTKALNNMAGARGNRQSGAQLKALTRFGTDYTGQQAAGSSGRFYGDQDRTFNRLSGIAGTGQTATTAGVQAGSQSAGNISSLISSGGNARGAAAIAQGNAWGGALNNMGNWWQQNQMLDQMRQEQAANRAAYGGGYGRNPSY